MERVEIIKGELPILLITPHGVDDLGTNEIAEHISKNFGTYAILNKGWRRGISFNYSKEIANCNDIRHLNEDVIKEEFLHPILRNVKKIKEKYKEKVLILILHGCGNHVRKIANDESLDLIIGFGDGSSPSYSCDIKLKNAFIYHLKRQGFGVYEGKTQYSGWSKYNLNQLFRKHYPDKYVNSLQIEIIKDLRNQSEISETSARLINVIDALTIFDDTMSLFQGETKKI